MKKLTSRILEGVIFIQAVGLVWFFVFGPVDVTVGPFRVEMADPDQPTTILVVALLLRLMIWLAERRERAFAAVAMTISGLMTVGLFEAYLQHYHQADFWEIAVSFNEPAPSYQFRRGPLLPFVEGVPHLLIQGDSISWGPGIDDWRKLYPNLLQERLGAAATIRAITEPGQEINAHSGYLRRFAPDVDPDIIVYQWYVNDIEIDKANRPPPPVPWWRSFAFVRWLSEKSFVASLIDRRMTELFYPYGVAYMAHLNEAFAKGTAGWFSYEKHFTDWAMYATHLADRVIMIQYPIVPYGDVYPIADLTRRSKALGGAHLFEMAPRDLAGIGRLVADGIRSATPDDGAGEIAYGPYVAMKPGAYRVAFKLRADGAPIEGVVVDVVSHKGEVTHARREVSVDELPIDAWGEVALPFVIEEEMAWDVEFRVRYPGHGRLSFGGVRLPLDFGIEVIDLLPKLTGVDTHVNWFDSHPNAATHRIMADQLIETLGPTLFADRP